VKYLPTSPGLTRPELTLRQGIVAAVLMILGASIKIMGDPISNLEGFSGNSGDDSFDSHLIKATTPFFGL